MATDILLITLGLGVGAFGTLVGAGGGFILTPLLLLLYPSDSPATVAAISLMVVFFNAASGSVAYARQRRIDYRSGAVFAVATLPGAIAGAFAVEVAPRRLFTAITAALLLGLSLWLLLRTSAASDATATGSATTRVITDRDGTTYRYSPRVGRGAVLSVGVGFVSSFLGIGGGIIHVPLLVGALGFPVHLATATSHFVLANMAFVGSLTHLAAGNFDGGDALPRALLISVGVVVGAQGGAWLSRRLHGRHIEQLLAAALVLLAVRLAVSVV